jgi:hypothetical protein
VKEPVPARRRAGLEEELVRDLVSKRCRAWTDRRDAGPEGDRAGAAGSGGAGPELCGEADPDWTRRRDRGDALGGEEPLEPFPCVRGDALRRGRNPLLDPERRWSEQGEREGRGGDEPGHRVGPGSGLQAAGFG